MNYRLREREETPRCATMPNYDDIFSIPDWTWPMQFADTRTAYDDLPEEHKRAIKDWVLWHSQHHSRRVANPGEPLLDQKKVCNNFIIGIQSTNNLIIAQFLPTSHPFGKHKLVQIHEPSGRTVSFTIMTSLNWQESQNLYIANHAYKVESLPLEQGQAEIKALLDHCCSPNYVCSVEWKNDGDLVIWDNTCVMWVPFIWRVRLKRPQASSSTWRLRGQV